MASERAPHPKHLRDVSESISEIARQPGCSLAEISADQIRRTISLASLDHLLLLRHDQEERARVVSEISRAGRDLVWRSQDDKQLYPDDAERSIVLALKRGLREFTSNPLSYPQAPSSSHSACALVSMFSSFSSGCSRPASAARGG
jgi:hypothetical protein